MPKRFEFSAEFDHPVERVHAVLIDEDYWRSRIVEGSRGTVRVESVADDDGLPLVTVTMTETVDPDRLPAVVARTVRGDLRMERIDTWRTVRDGSASGRLSGSSTGIPVTIDGEYRLRPGGSGSVLDIRGTVRVRIPLLGSQIELMVRKMVEQMVARDRDEAQRRLDRAV
ncbi:DUF2505 domain-containing protein [Rhodococcus sp. ABRD24]|uniref:DUF2505 domain-containing protein n=1 Tax=Rhodococcus sp. ABRD24 TaxID=2507582 RepID=UPI00103F2F69|nr:DUF2505 domain-containing protein [Rhodococcus sp. ABRD24]QBJ97573.1 DUF2505 domain-containing protein [Rhodococcus sp. ABRD24]